MSHQTVDGNTLGNFNRGTCTLTNNVTDTSPTWTLTFDEPMIVNSFDIVPIDDVYWRKYLSQARIQIYNTNNENVFNYTYWNYWSSYIFIVNFKKVALKKLTITATKESFPTAILSFCEINIFGDCQPGYWDLDCKKTCDSRCPTSCSVVDGSCTTHCLGYIDAASCTKECPPNKWGVNCRENCSDRCANRFCNNIDGSCTSGCKGYSDPPYCTKGSWKLDAICLWEYKLQSGQDPSRCTFLQSLLSTHSVCLSLVKSLNMFFSHFPLSDQVKTMHHHSLKPTRKCPPNKWGVNCRENCSDRCANRFCNNIDGSCTSGCKGYSDPPYCTKGSWKLDAICLWEYKLQSGQDPSRSCTNGRYGLNCASPFTETCPDCDSFEVTCLEEDNKLKGTYFGIGFGVCAVCILFILIFGVIYIKVIHRRYNICKQCVRQSTGDHDGVEENQTNVQPYNNGSASVDIGSLNTDRTTRSKNIASAKGRSIDYGYDVPQGGVKYDLYEMYRPYPMIQSSI
uniref:Fucolectin tachylectin-4 pentraxin-1 domain-containing protein n=1 Tax=Biomphalaria glabrata TaxID=6526 RepID=A0A2C9M2Q8_BIOGL